MPLDSSIALGVRQPEYENPLKQYANVLAIQGAQNQNALAQYGLAKAKRDDADQNALRASLSGVDISTPEGQAAARNALLRSGNVAGAAAFDKSLLERRKMTGEIDAKALETGVKALGLYREQLSNVTDPESAARWVAAQYSDPNLAPIVSRMGPMDQAIAKIPRDPRGFQTWLAQNAMGMDKFLVKNAPILSTKDVGGTVEDRTFRPLTGELSSLGTTAKTATPGDLLTDARGQVSNRIAAGNLGVAQGNLSVNRQRLLDARNPDLQAQLSAAGAKGKEIGQAEAELAIDPVKAATSARKILEAVNYKPAAGKTKASDDVSRLIDRSTSGMLQNAVAQGYGAVTGDATSGREAIGELTTLANKLTMDLMGGKLGAGVSNTDREFMLGQLGDIANANTPASERQAAWGRVVGRLNTIAGGKTAASKPKTPGVIDFNDLK